MPKRIAEQPPARQSMRSFTSQLQLRPPCPSWCLPNWCQVRPVVNSAGQVWRWDGWHVQEMRAVDVEYGVTTLVAIAASFEDPDTFGVLMRLAANQDDGEFEVFFTQSEAAALSRALGGSAGLLELMHERAETRTS